ncbi:MAG: DNA-3-methyladenine glycosylase I [Vicinamibacteria bacterium]|jgi:DNA-3-methyladenine glycosylase I|nr:DNA-3-methyladenine glycosylase I [Vicinamibacteria bacterium]
MSTGLLEGADGHLRCRWSGSDPLYLGYHDREWGRPVADDTRLFEKLSLEGFQSGLSWLTILRKRENFRAAFRGFGIEAVAAFTARDVKRLLDDAGIVRHRGKIESTINNARRALEVRREFGSLARFYWAFEPHATDRPGRLDWPTLKTLAETDASRRLAKELKKRGFSFVGPTTAYAFMQAMGLVNDHLEGCAFRAQVEKERHRFRRPGPAD